MLSLQSLEFGTLGFMVQRQDKHTIGKWSPGFVGLCVQERERERDRKHKMREREREKVIGPSALHVV